MFENKPYELEIQGLPYAVVIDAVWHHCDGEKWQYMSLIEINDIFIADYRDSMICANEIVQSIELSDLDISTLDSRTIAKKISDFILEKAKETFLSTSAHDRYYGI